jgi:sortase A
MPKETPNQPLSDQDEGRMMKTLRVASGLFGEVMIALSALILLFVVWQLWWTNVTANRAQASTIQTLEHGFSAPPQKVSPSVTPTRTPAPTSAKATTAPAAAATAQALDKNIPSGQAFAIIRIPRFGSGFARPVLQGTDHDTLIKGVGHYVGTGMPGMVGNFAVAGHRTTYGKPFYDIDLLQKGDLIIIETKSSYIVYAVDRHVIVTPDRIEVIDPVPQQPGVLPTQSWMTMTACNPKYSASQRYVVFSRLVTSLPRSGGLQAALAIVPPKVA